MKTDEQNATPTPGPWTAVEMTHYGEPGTGFWSVQPIGEPDNTWSAADARLAAAAPDLLAALTLMDCPVCDCSLGHPMRVIDHCTFCAKARAAIAKAGGR